ncbi:hypothetical protein [Acinetobacter sp. ULE_I092]|uniref:hypothetical protein n=1 Tax=Acinetobacter sp. ULE_I092 TaxID=3373075 RepID=UPI003AF7749C
MAVPEQTPYKEFIANGITKVFPLEFDVLEQDHLIVLVNDLEPMVGSWSLDAQNDTVVFTLPPKNGVNIKIRRDTPLERTSDYHSYDNSFRPQPVNSDFDRIWWKLQELGVADWILGKRINALKAYVDDRDDELRAYLMEEIRKQGVALDQLDEYYNYLMQQLAMIAVNKGWLDSFVVTWSGRTQEEKNKELISAQDYGAEGDAVTNDTQAFVNLEATYQGRTIDLQGKTYKVDRDFIKNNYINGSFRVVNSNKGKGLVTSAGSKYTFSTKNGQKIGELIPPLFDSEVQTNSTIIQSCFYNKRNNRIIGQRVLRSANGTAESVIDFYDYGKISAYPTPTFTSKPTSIIGHQSIGYIDKSDIYYAVTGDIKGQEKSKHITSFTLNTTNGDFENIKYLKVFGDDFSGSGNNCMCVSQSGKLLCVTGSHPSKGRYVRVFDLTQMTTEGNYSDKYLVEFGFAFHSGFNPQSICCDDENIYILHGTSGSNSKVEVFTIAGSYVATDHEFSVGSYDATLLPYYYYEPECLFIGDQGRLMACVAVGKKGGANARDSYTNLISSVNFQETLQLATDGARPLVTLNATKTIAHTKPITYSYLGSDGSLNTYLSVSSGATAYTPASGGYNLSLTVAGTAQPQIRLKNSLHDGLLQVSTGGTFGLFSLTTGKWICGVDTLGVVQMQHDIKVSGSVLPGSTVGAYKIGGTDNIWGSSYVKSRYYTATVFDTYGTGSPEGVLVAGVGSTYRNTSGGAGTTFYVKESGTGNTGWVAK